MPCKSPVLIQMYGDGVEVGGVGVGLVVSR